MSLDTSLLPPADARTHRSSRRIRLADLDATGRVRLDAIARLLQDSAIDDVAETGWGVPDHLWFVRRMRLDVIAPLRADRVVELETWCSGLAAVAAGRRWTVTGDAGGRIEVDSVWVHLDRSGRPQRIVDFGVYAVAAAGRPVSTRFELTEPVAVLERRPWPLRASDLDPHGHVNNAVHLEAVEDALVALGRFDPARPYRAEVEYREPLDLGDPLELEIGSDGPFSIVALRVGDATRALVHLGPLDAS